MKINYLKMVTLSLVFFVQFGFSQQQISGTVTDSSGNPLPGVTVVVQGESSGAQTDFDGNYLISANEGQTLEFSYLGMSTVTRTVGSQTVIDVTMTEDAQALGEVVVTALGVTRDKKALGYSVSTVGGDEVSEVKDANFLNSLSGKVAGVNVKYSGTMGGSTNVIVRGYASITGNNQALFVVDGTPIGNEITNTRDQRRGRGGYDYGNAAMDINPDDIASVSVLKGAAAAALYGSRGSNGVILITTKKGTTRKGKGLGVTVNSSVTFGNPDETTLPVYQDQYGAGYGPYYGVDNYFQGADYNETKKFYTDSDPNTYDVLTPPLGEDASYGAPFDPNKKLYQWNSIYPDLDTYGVATPWVAAENTPNSLFETATTFINSVSFEGSDEKGSFRLGYTNLGQSGILPNSSLERNTIAFSADRSLTDKLKASGRINYIKTDGKGRNGTGYDARNLFQSFRQWYQVNVDIQEQKDAYFKTKKNITWNPNSAVDTRPHYFDNPYWTLYENYQTDERNRYYGNFSLNYEITDWLDIFGRLTFDTYDELQEERINRGSVDVSEYQRHNGSLSEFNYDFFVNFNKDLTEDLNIDGTVGYNLRVNNENTIRIKTNGGIGIAGLYSLSNTVSSLEAPDSALEEEYSSTKKVEGIFGRLSTGYKNFLYLDLTYRVDRSSALPKDNNTYGYPSVSTSFVFNQFIKQPWLSFAKIRANYAEVGNDTDPYKVLNTYNLITPLNGVGMASNSSTFNNADLKEERTKSYEVGMELRFFSNRLGVDFSYYQTKTEDLLTPVDVSNASGVLSRWLNAGSMENKGYELSLTGTPLSFNDFSWDVTVNWSTYASEVLELYEGIENLQLASLQGGVSINAAPGEPYGTIRGTNYVYHENGQPIVLENGTYKKTSTSNEVIGNIIPDWNAGIKNRFSYKGVSASFLIDIQQGGDVFSLDTWYGYGTGIYDNTVGTNDLGNPIRNTIANGGGLILSGVEEDGTPNNNRADFSRYSNPLGWARANNAMHVYDASFVKLREVTLSYSLPTNVLDKLPFSHASLSIIGRNLWIIYKNVPYADPEAGLSAGNIQGYQSGAPPAIKEIGASIKLKF